MRRKLLAALFAVAAVVVVVACSNSGPSAPTPTFEAPAVAPKPEASTAVSSSFVSISNEDRIWWKSHVPKFSIEGTVVTVEGTNPWDHEVAQGDARDFYLKIFSKTSVPQTFVGQAGPIRIGAKDSFSLSVDIGFGYCFIEAELRLDTADDQQNGGPPGYLFGVADLDVAGCHKPKNPPGPSCQVVPVEDGEEEPEVASSAETEPLPVCDLCDNIEGYQDTIPLDESGQPYIRVFDDETGLFLCSARQGCGEGTTWEEQQPEVSYGEWGACTPGLEASTGGGGSSCSRSRLVTVIVYEVNTCTKERREKSRETRSESESCECPACYYTVSGNIFTRAFRCEAPPFLGGAGGDWGNWFNQPNHCKVPYDGVSRSDFNLVPGQSVPGCLTKND